MLLANVAMAWVAVRIQNARRQRETVEAIVKLGGQVTYDYQIDESGKVDPDTEPPLPKWLRNLLGDDFWASPTVASVNNDGALEVAARLPTLQTLILGGEKITDAGMRHLKDLPVLKSLVVFDTRVTDAGLAHLKACQHLRELRIRPRRFVGFVFPSPLESKGQRLPWPLQGPTITNAGLEHIAALPRLEVLDLTGAPIGDAGLRHLSKLPRLEHLNLSDTNITDAALVYLACLPNLRELSLADTGVADPGLENLRTLGHLRRLDLSGLPVTDTTLLALTPLANLQELKLRGDYVHDEVADEFRRAVPNCKIVF
jgi:hypothetical protein